MNKIQNDFVQENKSKALVVKKENILLKIPFIRKIYETIQNRKKENYIVNNINNKNPYFTGEDRVNLSDIPIKNYQRYNSQPNLESTNISQRGIRQTPINSPKINQMNMKEQLKQKNFQSQQPAIQEMIVISDLHGNYNKWELVKQQMIKNPNKKFIILGDAMDKGEYGLEILLEIKELSDRGRVQYLPGNHDIFAYNYLMRRGEKDAVYKSALKHLEYNGGKSTIQKLEQFDQVVRNQLMNQHIHNPITLKELTDWLGKLPIQELVRVNGNKYALAHAVFDTELYNYDKEFNLEKALNMRLKERKLRNIK